MNIREIIDFVKNRERDEYAYARKYFCFVYDVMLDEINKKNTKRNPKQKYPSLSNQQIEKIKTSIEKGNYDEDLKPLINKLVEYAGYENLLIFSKNLESLKLIKDKRFKSSFWDLRERFISGEYHPEDNIIYYYHQNSLPHEFLHVASTARDASTKDLYFSGFRYDVKNLSFQRGLNEGYTELLANRIFNNEHYYNDSAYTLNVYLLRIFELLYDNQKDMEKDYFLANYQGPANAFTKYGKIEEYLEFAKYLDFFAATKDYYHEDIDMFNHIMRIVKRVDDYGKMLEARKMKEEYFEQEKKAEGKVFSFTKKTF